MKTRVIKSNSSLESVEIYEGETIETKVSRIINEKAPIEDGAPIIFTDRAQGVLPAYDIRTDRWDIAVDAMDKVNKAKIAKREEFIKNQKGNDVPNKTEGGSPSEN
nr:MAG TPA: hypothetical protein [Bacteriophage sp.]